MITPNWQLQTPIDALVFDCDGSLTALEGIDELAKQKGVADQVSALTEEAMGKSGMNISLFRERLDLVRPHRDEVFALGTHYFEQRIPDLCPILEILQTLGKKIFIVSAGLYPAVERFGQQLGIPGENIFAVKVEFDQQGHYRDFDHSSPLVTRDGKRSIVSQLKTRYPQLAYLGDGLNDIAVYDLVTRFLGFGGCYYRENIANRCQFYIATRAMSPLLPLALTEKEKQTLSKAAIPWYQAGMDAIEGGKVIIREKTPRLLKDAES